MIKQFALIFVSVVALVFSQKGTAQNIATDRPNQTEAATVIRPGELQIESGILFERYEVGGGLVQERTSYPINLFRIGLSEKFEFRMVNQLVAYRLIDPTGRLDENRVRGTENVQLGLKYQLKSKEDRLVMALQGHIFLPTGSTGITNELYGAMGRLNLAYEIDEQRSLGSNIAYVNEFLDFAPEGLVRRAEGNFIYTLAYSQSLSNQLTVFAEFFTSAVELEDWETNADVGLTYLLKENLQLDYVYGFGLNRSMNFHTIGLSIRLPH